MRNFTDLITAYAWTKDADRKRQIGENIWRWYGAPRTVLVVDLCGFGRSAKGETGILDFLAIIRRMQAAARPIIWANDGEIVKMEADNCFAVFLEPEAAARAALELVATANNIQAVERVDLEMCCGLECGRILYLKEQEFFGEAVNTASKLGEDLADKDEVLVGPELRRRLAAKGWRIEDDGRRSAPAGSGRILEPPSG